MSSHLAISVQDLSTLIHYVVDNEVVVSHTHDIGLKHIEAEGLGTIAGSKLLDGVLYTLEFVSLRDRIPTEFRVIAPRHATWIIQTLRSGSYTQFFTDGVPLHVTLEHTTGPSRNYARHTKTVFSFKV